MAAIAVDFVFRSIHIHQDDFARLDEDCHLNDNVMDFYWAFLQRKLLVQRHPLAADIYFFNSSFHVALTSEKQPGSLARRWERNVQLFRKRLIFIPFNEEEHWLLFVLVNLPATCTEKPVPPTLLFLDSFPGPPPPADFLQKLRSFLQLRLEYEVHRFKALNVDPKGVTLQWKEVIPLVPIQENESDCGVYVLHYAELLCLPALTCRLLEKPSKVLEDPALLHFERAAVAEKRAFLRGLMMHLSDPPGARVDDNEGAYPMLDQEQASVQRHRLLVTDHTAPSLVPFTPHRAAAPPIPSLPVIAPAKVPPVLRGPAPADSDSDASDGASSSSASSSASAASSPLSDALASLLSNDNPPDPPIPPRGAAQNGKRHFVGDSKSTRQDGSPTDLWSGGESSGTLSPAQPVPGGAALVVDERLGSGDTIATSAGVPAMFPEAPPPTLRLPQKRHQGPAPQATVSDRQRQRLRERERETILREKEREREAQRRARHLAPGRPPDPGLGGPGPGPAPAAAGRAKAEPSRARSSPGSPLPAVPPATEGQRGSIGARVHSVPRAPAAVSRQLVAAPAVAPAHHTDGGPGAPPHAHGRPQSDDVVDVEEISSDASSARRPPSTPAQAVRPGRHKRRAEGREDRPKKRRKDLQPLPSTAPTPTPSHAPPAPASPSIAAPGAITSMPGTSVRLTAAPPQTAAQKVPKLPVTEDMWRDALQAQTQLLLQALPGDVGCGLLGRLLAALRQRVRNAAPHRHVLHRWRAAHPAHPQARAFAARLGADKPFCEWVTALDNSPEHARVVQLLSQEDPGHHTEQNRQALVSTREALRAELAGTRGRQCVIGIHTVAEKQVRLALQLMFCEATNRWLCRDLQGQHQPATVPFAAECSFDALFKSLRHVVQQRLAAHPIAVITALAGAEAEREIYSWDSLPLSAEEAQRAALPAAAAAAVAQVAQVINDRPKGLRAEEVWTEVLDQFILQAPAHSGLAAALREWQRRATAALCPAEAKWGPLERLYQRCAAVAAAARRPLL